MTRSFSRVSSRKPSEEGKAHGCRSARTEVLVVGVFLRVGELKVGLRLIKVVVHLNGGPLQRVLLRRAANEAFRSRCPKEI